MNLNHFLPYQLEWITDHARLKIMQKCRQAGLTYADAFANVRNASRDDALNDVYVSSRDEFLAQAYIAQCKEWAQVLQLLIVETGEFVIDPDAPATPAHYIQFANGKRIYSVSSHPNAFAGKHGDVTLDEFALHENQQLLYQVAKPVTTWGGHLSIISTHRGPNTLFNQIIRDIKFNGNPMGWRLHTVTIHDAVNQGLVDRINKKTGQHQTPDDFLTHVRGECINQEQWEQEYCCMPSDHNSAFLSDELIRSCETPDCLRDFEYLRKCRNPLYLGMDVARKHDLCVIDVGEKIDGVVWDRFRMEFTNVTLSEAEKRLHQFLELPSLRRACIDATALGTQLAENARDRFPYRVQPVTFTVPIKEKLAFGLKADFDDRKLRIAINDRLRADLHGLRKEVTASGKILFTGEAEDSHCDRTWALALRQHAARYTPTASAMVC